MNLFRGDAHAFSSERLITLSIVTIITVASTVLMLLCASPEFSWDEADYVASSANNWSFLWGGSDYGRHGHGPLTIYLAKLGQELLPAAAGSLEGRLRFFEALVGSVAVGLLYLALRRSFRTSHGAALVGSSLLLFSVIRLEETNLIGPHHLMLACTLATITWGYQWRDKPTLQAAIGLGVVLGFGALSMTYVIPTALCWAVAVSLAGKEWIAWDRTHLKVSWSIPIILVTAAIVVVALWPPGVLHRVLLGDFRWYLHYPYHPTLVGDRIFEVTPRSAAAYWLAHLDVPIVVFSVFTISIALWRAFRGGHLSSKHIYLAVFLAFFLTIALVAHIAGARNLLLFIGILCLATGALFDEALGYEPPLIWFGSAAVTILAALNLMWLSRSPSYTPYLATNGYRAFLKEEQNRLREKVKAVVYGSPILNVYAQQYGTSIAWDVSEMLWTTRADAPLPAEVKYVLIPAFVYNHMPPEQPVRRVVAEHWKVVWSFKADHVWELRLYGKPQATAIPAPALSPGLLRSVKGWAVR
jgi:Dolichyl-phosphate-mannose-protein mannosyltransferase